MDGIHSVSLTFDERMPSKVHISQQTLLQLCFLSKSRTLYLRIKINGTGTKINDVNVFSPQK